MAITTNSQLMGLKGRVGALVSYQWRGKWVTRSFSTAPKNPRSEKQQAHRMLFKQEVQLAGRMNWVLRETLDAVAGEHGMTACNYFIKRNQEAFGAEDGVLTVDWPRLVLSEGPVAPVAFGVPEITEGTTLTVAFERNPLHMPSGNYDRVYVYLYCPELQTGFFTAPVYRRDRRLSVVLPEQMAGHEVQLWGMVQDHAGRWSETIYIGCGPLENTAETAQHEPGDEETEPRTESYHTENMENSTKEKASLREAPGWSVGDSNSRPLPCEGSALNQLS